MERLMERKLALLEADYQETLAAEARATTARSRTSPAAARAAGYVDPSGYSQQLVDGHEGEEDGVEWSEAWTQFQADVREEEDRIRALPPSDDEAPAPPPPPVSIHAPLTPAKISAIRSHMSTIKLRPPPWAIGMSEEVWMARILERAGFARRAQPMSEERKEGGREEKEEAKEGREEEQKRRRRARKKAKKGKQAKKAQTTEERAGVVEEAKQDDGFSEFEPSFPSLVQPTVDATAQTPSESKANE